MTARPGRRRTRSDRPITCRSRAEQLRFVGLIVAGILFGLRGATELILSGIYAEPDSDKMASGITYGLRGVELILLSGLLLLFVNAIGNYVVKMMSLSNDRLPIETRLSEVEGALWALMSVKRLTAALLASLVATHLVGEVLQWRELTGFLWIFQIAVFVLLLAFLRTMESSTQGGRHGGVAEEPEVINDLD